MATLTITTTAAQDARIVVAFGQHLKLGRNATASEIKTEVIRWIRHTVQENERAVQVEAITVEPIDPT